MSSVILVARPTADAASQRPRQHGGEVRSPPKTRLKHLPLPLPLRLLLLPLLDRAELHLRLELHRPEHKHPPPRLRRHRRQRAYVHPLRVVPRVSEPGRRREASDRVVGPVWFAEGLGSYGAGVDDLAAEDDVVGTGGGGGGGELEEVVGRGGGWWWWWCGGGGEWEIAEGEAVRFLLVVFMLEEWCGLVHDEGVFSLSRFFLDNGI